MPKGAAAHDRLVGRNVLLLPGDCILASTSCSSSSDIMFSKMSPDCQRRACCLNYSLLPRNRAVEMMACRRTDAAIIPYLVEHQKKLGMIPLVAANGFKGMVMDRIWAAVKREVIAMLAEGFADPEHIDTLWREMFSDRDIGPTSEYLRMKYVHEGKLESELPNGVLRQETTPSATSNGHMAPLQTSKQPTLFFLDVGVGENVNSMEEAMTAGKILSTTPDGKQINTIITGQSYPDGIDISFTTGRLFWTNMGVTGVRDGSILSANLDGSDILTIVPKGTLHTPKQLTIDQKNSHLYFCDREGLSVYRCNIDGSNLTRLIQTGDLTNHAHTTDPLCHCIGIAIDPTRNLLYWTPKGAPKAGQDRIFRASMTIPPNSTPPQEPTSSSSSPISLNPSTLPLTPRPSPSGGRIGASIPAGTRSMCLMRARKGRGRRIRSWGSCRSGIL